MSHLGVKEKQNNPTIVLSINETGFLLTVYSTHNYRNQFVTLKKHIQNILHPPSESTFLMLHKQIVILGSCMTSFTRVKSALGLFSNNELFYTQESPSPIKTSDGDILRESMTNTKYIFFPRE